MQTDYLISIDDFCINHNIEISFVNRLQQTGLIEIKKIENTGFIDSDQIRQLERIISFYYDLDINLEGIETINSLLQQISSMQQEITALRNRLLLYESEMGEDLTVRGENFK